MPVEQVPGVHGGTVFHDGRGHIFRRQREFRGVLYMVCAHSTCPARGTMIISKDTIEEKRPHNHDPDLDLPKALVLRKKILQRCRREKASTREIYREEISKAGHLGTHEVLCSMFSSLQRARSSVLPPYPPVPESLLHYQEQIKISEYMKFGRTLSGEQFFLDVVQSGHGDVSAIFMSPNSRKLLKGSEVFYIDATFKYVPRIPSCVQLTTVTAMQGDNGFAVALVLMSKCSRMAYVTILRRLLQEEPEWSPSVVIANSENILQSALDEVFGTTGRTSVLVSWYQYTQDLWKRLAGPPELPPLEEGSSALLGARMAMALPVLPPALFSTGVSEIISFFMDELDGKLSDQMLEFLQYVDEQWIEKYRERLSVNSLVHKLNYDIETLHHKIMVYMVSVKNSTQPKFWEFISGLQKFESDQSKILKTFKEKGKISKARRKRHYQTQNKQIQNLCSKLNTKAISVREFLIALTQRVYKASLADDDENYTGEELTKEFSMVEELQNETDAIEEFHEETEIAEGCQKEVEATGLNDSQLNERIVPVDEHENTLEVLSLEKDQFGSEDGDDDLCYVLVLEGD